MIRNEHKSLRKVLFSVISAALLVLSFGSAVFADAFEDYNDYQNPDGTYSYYFAEGVTVTMDEFWYQNTMVVPGERGAAFYHKASYQAYQKDGGVEGGRLFTLSASVNTDFRKLPSYEYIDFDEDEAMNYFAILPTDYQAYAGDEKIQAEYDALWAGVKDVISEIQLSGEHKENNSEDRDSGNTTAVKSCSSDKKA